MAGKFCLSRRKIVLWAYNLHVGNLQLSFDQGRSFTGQDTYQTMGAHLKQMFGDDIYLIGLGFNHGELQGASRRSSRTSPRWKFILLIDHPQTVVRVY